MPSVSLLKVTVSTDGVVSMVSEVMIGQGQIKYPIYLNSDGTMLYAMTESKVSHCHTL